MQRTFVKKIEADDHTSGFYTAVGTRRVLKASTGNPQKRTKVEKYKHNGQGGRLGMARGRDRVEC